MSKPPSSKSMTRSHIWLYDEDIERLHKYFGQNIGFSRAARNIINSYLNNIEAKAMAQHGVESISPQGLDELIQKEL